MWAMTVTGLTLLVVALLVLIDATFQVFVVDEQRPFEEIAFLLTTGVAFLWFGSPRFAEAQRLNAYVRGQLDAKGIPPDQIPADPDAPPSADPTSSDDSGK